jgi:hypothetical protein
MQRKLKEVTSPFNATQLPCDKTSQTCVPKQLVLKTISDSIGEHENCSPQTLNILPL